MLQNLKDFNSMPFMSKIEYLRTTAIFYHPIEKGNYHVTTALDDDGWRKRTSMCKEYTAPSNRWDSKPYASIDAQKEIGAVLNIEIATIIDVLGIEVQVLSVSSPGYWILISRGHERFVNEIHRHYSDIVSYSSSSRIFQTCRGKSKRRLNFQACIGKPLPPRYGQRRQQQSYINTSKSKVHLREERDHQGGHNLDYNSWMPEMQEGFIWDSHLQVCHKHGSTPWPRWTRNRWSEALGWCTLSVEREIPKSTGERVHGRGLAPLLSSGKHQDKVWNL